VSESPAPKRPEAPRDLGDAGGRVWRHIWKELPAGLELDERETLILREACGVADDISRLDGLLENAKDERGELRVSVREAAAATRLRPPLGATRTRRGAGQDSDPASGVASG